MTATLFTLQEALSILRDPTRDQRHLGTQAGPELTAYLAWKRLSNAAGRTLDQIERDLARLVIEHPTLGVDDFTHEHLQTTLAEIPSKSWRRYRVHWRGWFKWAILHDRRTSPKNPVDLLPPLLRQQPVKVYRIFNSAEQQAILNATRHTLDPPRDRVRAHLLLDAGMRAGEALGMVMEDYDPLSRVVILRGKGEKERAIVLPQAFARAWDDYLLTSYPKLDRGPEPGDHVWFPMRVAGAYGNRERQVTASYPWKPLVYSGFWGWWRTLLELAEVPYRKPHMTRHTYATDALEATDGDLYGVKELLGHSSTRVTEMYLHTAKARRDRAAARLAAFRAREDDE